MKTKLSASVQTSIAGFLASNFELSQEGLVILKKQSEVYEDFLSYCKKSQAKGVKDVEPLQVVTAYLHSNSWPIVREKPLGMNKVEDNLVRTATFASTGELIEDSLDAIQLVHWQGIQFYHGLRKHLAYKRKVVYQGIISDHADIACQEYADSDTQTEDVKKGILFGACDDCISALCASGLVDKDKENQLDKAETDFFVACYDRGLAVASSETETDETDSTEGTEEPAEAILKKSDLNIAKAFAGLIDSEVSEADKEKAYELFEQLCGMIRDDLYDESIQELG